MVSGGQPLTWRSILPCGAYNGHAGQSVCGLGFRVALKILPKGCAMITAAEAVAM